MWPTQILNFFENKNKKGQKHTVESRAKTVDVSTCRNRNRHFDL